MKVTTMFRDLWQSTFSKPATEPFPNPEPNEVERLRGKLHWTPEQCTGCQLCVKDCPADALKLFTIDKKTKQFVMLYDVGKCTFCAQCVQACRFNCIELRNDEWSLSDTSKARFTIFYGDEEHVQRVLAGNASDDSETTE
jgi:formate hydrogenlyase subunit 6/NADH:ubiquinone oxidoreductase subunit I